MLTVKVFRSTLLPAVLLLALVTMSQAQAPRIRVEIAGTERIDARVLEEELRAAGLLRTDSAALAALPEAIVRHAEARALYFSRAEVRAQFEDDSSSALLHIEVHEGPVITVEALRFEGARTLTEAELLEACDTRPGSVFSELTLNADIARLLDLHERQGFPFARIRVGELVPREDSAAVWLTVPLLIDEGMAFTVEEFVVEGNAVTDPDVIIRETRLARGARFDSDAFVDVRRRLERTQLFTSVAEPQLFVRDGKGGVLLRVVEGNMNLFDGVIGYQPPRVEGEQGYVTGLVNVSFRNLFGTGRRMDARWERATNSISELSIRYLEPWVFGVPFNIQGGYRQRQQDSAFVRRDVDLSLVYLATSDLRVTLRGTRSDLIVSEFSTLPSFTNSVSVTGGVDIGIDTRDDVYNPRAGIELRNSYDGGSKSFSDAEGGGQRSEYIQRIEVDAAAYQLLLPRLVAALGLHGRELRGGALDIGDLYRLGGATTLRGYREEQFLGTRLGWANAELRYSLGRRSFTFLFFDIGHIEQSGDAARGREEMRLTRRGYGLGLRLETGLGIMSISYALGEGDGLSDGKIHFGLINEF